MPNIPRVQRMIEEAWNEGLDPQGASHFNRRLQGTRAWIGATEIYALLTSLGLEWVTPLPLVHRLHRSSKPNYIDLSRSKSAIKKSLKEKPPQVVTSRGGRIDLKNQYYWCQRKYSYCCTMWLNSGRQQTRKWRGEEEESYFRPTIKQWFVK